MVIFMSGYFNRKVKIFILVFSVLFSVLSEVNIVAADTASEEVAIDDNSLYSKACALTDGGSGRLLYGKSADTELPNASTTKIMTCILALELCETDEVVTFSAEAAAQPKVHLGASEGERFYLGDLLYGLMLESYNDCAWAIAEHAAGTVEEFASLMNEKAAGLGCKNTHFVTPNGLDDEDGDGEHHTTAYDLCLIMSYCAWDSEMSGKFLEITQTRNYSINSLDGSTYSVSNANAFLDMMDGVLTGKTGYTAKAGYCYVAAYEDGKRRYCIALLACGWPTNKTWRWKDAKTLFSYGLSNYKLYRTDPGDFEIEPVEVGGGYESLSLDEWGTKNELKLTVDTKDTEITFLMAGWESATAEKNITKPVTLPVVKGDVMGTVSYGINGEELYTYDILAADTFYPWDFNSFLKAVINTFFCNKVL
jgi:D-alanyl-D-alanine carboxypeptidase (penicillin-binding protein 5/6)